MEPSPFTRQVELLLETRRREREGHGDDITTKKLRYEAAMNWYALTTTEKDLWEDLCAQLHKSDQATHA